MVDVQTMMQFGEKRQGQGRRYGRIVGWLTALLLTGLALAGNVQVARAQGTVSVEMFASTSGEEDTVFNGDTVAYTIVVNNGTANAITDIAVLDVLPPNVLDNVACLDGNGAPPCTLITETKQVPEPLGGTITVTTTRQISWNVSQIAAGASRQFAFTARVIGQAEGTSFSNVAYISYREGTVTKSQASPEVTLTVRLQVETGGATTLSETPTWFSQDVGGTLSMDWADFDFDGDLDLVLGSTLGTTVYRNAAGRLELFWSNTRRAFGVRWADVNGDRRPDLIAVGDVTGAPDGETNLAQFPGVNYVYRYDPTAGASNRRFTELDTFDSPVQMVRVEAADLTGDGAVDLVVSSNAINAACPVELYANDGAGAFGDTKSCVSRAASAALKPADFDRDGDSDLAIGLFPNRVRVLVNNGTGQFDPRIFESVEEAVLFLPYDFAWGDYDGDGFLDLAAAYPLMREARIYRNIGGAGFASPLQIRTTVFLTPYALDWGDISGDGRIDLALADSPPKVYVYNKDTNSFSLFFALGEDAVQGQVWSVRVVDQNNDGDMDLTLSDRDGPSLVISNFRPPLSRSRTTIRGVTPFPDSAPSSSVTWGDADGDQDLDLFFGAGPAAAGPAALGSEIYYNDAGEFPSETVRAYGGFGPQIVTVGDADRDGDMDVAIGTTTEQKLHLAGDFLAPTWIKSEEGDKHLAFGDMDGDVDLDLVATTNLGADSHVELFINTGAAQYGADSVWRATIPDARASALADFDGDGFLDIAVAVSGNNRIYRNNRDATFALYWTAADAGDARAVDWADYDGDGDPDLAVGNYGAANVLYENQATAQVRTFTQVAATGQLSRTTSLDWGDWDNDGDLDLAVGNYGEPDQIFVNLDSSPGNPQFFWLWSSEESLNTTGIAFGDKDNDGDLDLAVSQDGPTLNGIYENNLVVPTHLAGASGGQPLPINPPLYLYTGRPGQTDVAYRFSSAEILSGPGQGPVNVDYRIYNPAAGSTLSAAGVPAGTSVLTPTFEFSVNGGGTWRTATSITQTLTPFTDAEGAGFQGSFVWDAIRDQAIGDDARFRIKVVQGPSSGPVQRASATTISAPFRVRAITCIWPEGPELRAAPAQSPAPDESGFDLVVEPDTLVRFTGKVEAGTGPLFYTWDFGDGGVAEGQVAEKVFGNGTYRVRMAVTGNPCPQTRERAESITLRVGTGQPDLHLPLIATTPVSPTAPADGVAAVAALPVEAAAVAPRPAQVRGLDGDVQFDSGAVWLRWQPSEDVRVYRVYRGDRAAEWPLALLAEVAPDAPAYRDEDPGCDQIYYVTAVTGSGLDAAESLPSTGSFYGPLCAP
jgi:uncharacterized repeat protein (TIGR01451 family)